MYNLASKLLAPLVDWPGSAGVWRCDFMAVQPAGEFNLADFGSPHCGVEGQLGFRQCR
jgi:hypothetical protein